MTQESAEARRHEVSFDVHWEGCFMLLNCLLEKLSGLPHCFHVEESCSFTLLLLHSFLASCDF